MKVVIDTRRDTDSIRSGEMTVEDTYDKKWLMVKVGEKEVVVDKKELLTAIKVFEL